MLYVHDVTRLCSVRGVNAYLKTQQCVTKVGRGNSGHGVIRATSTLQQERSIHWILASSEL